MFTRDDDRILRDSMMWEHEHMDDITLHSLSEEGFARLNFGNAKTRVPHQFGKFPSPSGKF